ncbi:MAG: peptide transporter [Planctomycetota bacterium]|jgi:hypothetical protein|nr:peptide transporter [Planctomycetota bacterium]
MSKALRDKELNAYRDLVKPAGYFEDGFTWRTMLGTLFVGLVMLPASMYMHLMIGAVSLAPAAQWVTVILFLEMAKRARSFLKPSEILILQTLIFIFVGQTPIEGFFWRQYIVQSDAARSFGLDTAFPDWFAPTSQEVLDQRSFFHTAWVVPLLVLFAYKVVERLDSLILGYGFFRIASDLEKLPFPMAPIGAAGIMALSENTMGKDGWRWRCFSISSAIGMVFGLLYIGVPTISSTFLKEPFQILPIPWLDTTVDTQDILPATATGLSFDMANFFAGMAFPFFAVLGGFIGLIVTLVANPYLHEAGILQTWKPGMSTVETLFANNIDFYLSFGIGLSLAVAVIGVYQVISSLREKRRATLDNVLEPEKFKIPKGRGDIRPLMIVGVYLCSASFYILLAGILLDWDFQGWGLPLVLLFFALVYIPFISYVTARLEGLVGQVLSIPFIREAAFIMSGYQGLYIWLLPLPLTANYGQDTVQYRVAELVGCSFKSIWKVNAVALPTVFILSIMYGQFIWSLAPIPSAQYPFAMEMWDFHARNQLLVFSSTNAGYSPFMDALKPWVIATGAGLGVATYAGLAAFGLPIMLLYGTVKGLGQTMPQFTVTQIAGAVFGRYVMARKFGPDRWREYSVVLFAGFNCGAGLVMMFATGLRFLASSVYQLPF